MAASVIVVRQVLLLRLDDRVDEDLTQEVEEFETLAGGVDPETGRPFGRDVDRIFEVYLSRNVPGEGEELITVPRRGTPSYLSSERVEPAAEALLDPTRVSRWRTLEEVERASVETVAGEARYIAVPVEAPDRTLGTFVVANFPRGAREEVNEAVVIVAAVGGIVLAVGTLLAVAFTGRVLAPLRELRAAADSIGGQDLSQRIELQGDDELAELATTFNGMLDRLEDAFGSQREFLRDASHELRTPVAIIRGHLELLGNYDQSADERRETVELVTDELDRMRRFIDDLMLLAKSERPDFLQLRTVDLAEIVESVRAKSAAIGTRKWRTEDSGARRMIVADPQRISQALLALTDNAVNHTTRGDEVTIGATVNGDWATVWVEDSGPGVSEEDRSRIFSRLVRGEGAARYEGTGLGLAIVRAIAEAHGGTARLASGSRFELALPVDPEVVSAR